MLEIGQIVKGHISEVLGLNKDISEGRLKICKDCPLYLESLGGICNRKLWLNPETEDVSIEEKDGYVRGCNCRLRAKTKLANAKCPAGKW